MIESLNRWWRARTDRERLLLRGAGVLIFAVVAPLWAYQSAHSFRARAGAELAAARETAALVAQIAGARAGARAPAGDGSLRGRVTAAAHAAGLEVRALSPAGSERLRVSFAAANSLAVYRWIDAMASGGAQVTSTVITRAGEDDTVVSEFEVASGP